MKKLKFLFGKKGVISLYGVVVALIVCIMLCGYMDLTQTTHVVEEIQSILDITALSTLQGSLDAEGVRFDRLTLRDYTYFLPDDNGVSEAERLAINSETADSELLEALKADSERLQDVTIWIDGTNADNVNDIAVERIILRNFNYYLTKLLHTGTGASKQPLFDYSDFDENHIVTKDYEGDSIIKRYEIREFDAGLKYWSWGVDAEDKDGNYQKVPQAYLATTIWLYLSVEPTFSALNLSIEESQIYNALNSANSTSSLHVEGYTDDGLLAVSIRTLSRMTVQGFIASDDTADLADLGVNFDAMPYTPEEYFDITDAGVVTGFSDEYYALPKEERPTNIKMPMTIKGITPVAIGDNAFDETDNDDDITLMVLPASITTIGKEAFLNVENMKNFGIIGSSKLTTIGESAFKNCKALLTFTCPNGVKEIPAYAFYGCTNMSSFKFSTALEKIGTSAFENCTRLKGTLSLPDSIKTIQDKAFFNCSAVHSLHIPQNLNSLGSAAFGRLGGLSTIDNNKNNPNFEVVDNVLYEKEADGTYALVVYPAQRKNAMYTIPLVKTQLVTRIADYAFYGNKYIDTLYYDSGNPDESKEMLQGIRTVGASAFERCTLIKQLQFAGDIVTDAGILQRQGLQTIGDNAFYNTTGLMLVYIDKLKNSVDGSPWGANTFQTAIRWKADDTFDWSMIYRYTQDGVILGLTDYGADIVRTDPSFQLIIPEILNDEYWGEVHVKAIGDYAFSCDPTHSKYASANSKIKQLEIVAPITSIGVGAFFGSPMENFTLTDGVTQIGDSAFANSAIVTFLINDIPGREIVFGNSVFEGCKNLEEFTIPLSMKTVGTGLFKNCISLQNVIITALWEEIPASTFSGCTKLKDVEFSHTIVKIGDYAFEKCSTMTGLGATTQVTHVGKYAFTECNSLEVLQFGEMIVEIGEYAFLKTGTLATVKLEVEEDFVPGQPWGADTFTDIIWKNSKWVKYYVYETAANGTWKIIGLSELGREVLNNKSITAFQTPAYRNNEEVVGFSITSADDKAAMKNMTSMKIVAVKHDNGYPIAGGSFEGCTSLKTFEMSNVITSIGDKTFKDCSALLKISVPSSVTSLGAYAFQNCVNLEQAVIGVGVTNIKEYTFQNCKKLKSLSLLGAFTNVGTYAFNNCTALPDFHIKNATATMGDYAFKGCTSLTKVTCDGDPKLTQFSIGIFEDCTALKTLYMPKTVTVVKEDAFKNCTSLTDINNADASKLVTIEEEAFMNTTSLSKLPSFNNLTTIGTKAFYETGAVTIESQPALITIGASAFYNSTRLTEIKACSSLTTIKNSAFTGCTALVTLANMTSLNTIEASAFQNCFALNDFVQSSVKTVGERAFAFCRSLKTVTSSSLQTVEMSAFSACTSLTTIDAPNLVELKNNAFSGCLSLTSMTRSDSLTTIGSAVFVDSPMTVMHLGSSISHIASEAFTFMDSLNTIHIHRGEYQSMTISNHSDSTTSIANSRQNEPWGSNASVIWYNTMKVGSTTISGTVTAVDTTVALPVNGGTATHSTTVYYNGDAQNDLTGSYIRTTPSNYVSWNYNTGGLTFTAGDNTWNYSDSFQIKDKYGFSTAIWKWDVNNTLALSTSSISKTISTYSGDGTDCGTIYCYYSGDGPTELNFGVADGDICSASYNVGSNPVALTVYTTKWGGSTSITVNGQDCESKTVSVTIYHTLTASATPTDGEWGGGGVGGYSSDVSFYYTGNAAYLKLTPSSTNIANKGGNYNNGSGTSKWYITAPGTLNISAGNCSETITFTCTEWFRHSGNVMVIASDSYSTSATTTIVHAGPASHSVALSHPNSPAGVSITYSGDTLTIRAPAGCADGSFFITLTASCGLKTQIVCTIDNPTNDG